MYFSLFAPFLRLQNKLLALRRGGATAGRLLRTPELCGWTARRLRLASRHALQMETGRELLSRVGGPLGERGVAFDAGDWSAQDLDVFADPTQRGHEGRTLSGYTAVMIVPTGVGAKIGGYAGDALPVARAMSSVVDTLITHPNVVNGAMLYWPMPNMLYTEGYALDLFAQGLIGLIPVTSGGHRIGLLLDSALGPDLIARHLQVADAARATMGINVARYIVTDQPVGVRLTNAASGASDGDIDNPQTLLLAARRLVDEAGCTAIAVVCNFPDDETEEDVARTRAYMQGNGVDPVGGAEALISRLIGMELGVPVAHSPGCPVAATPDNDVAPKTAAEELGFTFLPCVLAYLHRAPALVAPQDARASRAIWANDVDALVLPASG